MTRRHLLAPVFTLAAATPKPTRLRLALNAYSFNQPLRAGKITLFDVLNFCDDHQIEGLDATGYYFQLPRHPPPQFIRDLKRHALLRGVTIYGTGIRNDFATADTARRNADLILTQRWTETAAHLGASILRVFGGRPLPTHESFDDAFPRMVEMLREAAGYGRQHGVLMGLQNHNEAIKTAAETIRLLRSRQLPWLGVVLDIGSLRQHDPYAEIEALIPTPSLAGQRNPSGSTAAKPSTSPLAQVIRRRLPGLVPIENPRPRRPLLKLPPSSKKSARSCDSRPDPPRPSPPKAIPPLPSNIRCLEPNSPNSTNAWHPISVAAFNNLRLGQPKPTPTPQGPRQPHPKLASSDKSQ